MTSLYKKSKPPPLPPLPEEDWDDETEEPFDEGDSDDDDDIDIEPEVLFPTKFKTYYELPDSFPRFGKALKKPQAPTHH